MLHSMLGRVGLTASCHTVLAAHDAARLCQLGQQHSSFWAVLVCPAGEDSQFLSHTWCTPAAVLSCRWDGYFHMHHEQCMPHLSWPARCSGATPKTLPTASVLLLCSWTCPCRAVLRCRWDGDFTLVQRIGATANCLNAHVSVAASAVLCRAALQVGR
jgi:hypothetical protein